MPVYDIHNNKFRLSVVNVQGLFNGRFYIFGLIFSGRISLGSRRRGYHPVLLENALAMVICGEMNPTQASRVYGVPRRTIRNRIAKLQQKR